MEVSLRPGCQPQAPQFLPVLLITEQPKPSSHVPQQARKGSFKRINSECGPHQQGGPLLTAAEFRETLVLNVLSKNSSQAVKSWQEAD